VHAGGQATVGAGHPATSCQHPPAAIGGAESSRGAQSAKRPQVKRVPRFIEWSSLLPRARAGKPPVPPAPAQEAGPAATAPGGTATNADSVDSSVSGSGKAPKPSPERPGFGVFVPSIFMFSTARCLSQRFSMLFPVATVGEMMILAHTDGDSVLSVGPDRIPGERHGPEKRAEILLGSTFQLRKPLVFPVGWT
jgi:hypothetical protein